MTLLDTNAILRYLLSDLPLQAEQSADVIRNGAFTIPEVVAEVVYVLYKLYSVPRQEISGIVSPIFDETEIEHKDVIKNALWSFILRHHLTSLIVLSVVEAKCLVKRFSLLIKN